MRPSYWKSIFEESLQSLSGKFEQYIRDEAGSVASFGSGRFRCQDRLAEFRQRFVLSTEVADDDASDSLGGGPLNLLSLPAEIETEWSHSFTDHSALYLEQEGESWIATAAPWPSGAPVAVLYWMLGVPGSISLDSSRGLTHTQHFAVGAQAAVGAQKPDLRDGVKFSLESSNISLQETFSATARIESGRLANLTVLLNDPCPVSISTDFFAWGDAGKITLPETLPAGPAYQIEELFNKLTFDSQEDH